MVSKGEKNHVLAKCTHLCLHKHGVCHLLKIYVFGRCGLSVINLHLLQQTWLEIVSWSPLKNTPLCDAY